MRNDLSAYWMPFTANRAFKGAPRMLASALGMYYQDAGGRQILDGAAGLWCVNAGHTRPKISAAIAAEAGRLDFAPSFQFGHASAFELASRIADLMPSGLDRVFFTNSGSEAVDTALKIALAYHRARGEGSRTRLIGRERGYHGVGFGGISVGGIGPNRKSFGPLLPGVDHLRHTYDPGNPFIKGQPADGAHLADDLETLVALHGADTIAAVIVEPMAGSTGVLPPPVGYLERLRDISQRHGILLIFDEVITGFGRVGAATAAGRFGVTPDIITMAKGISNGAVPMGAAVASRKVHDAIVDGAPAGIELFHGYTYSAHPLAVAAALATLDVYAEEGLFERSRALEIEWQERLHMLRDAPHVRDLRNIGLVGAVELDPRDGAPGARGGEMLQACFDAGLLVRTTGDIIALSPPLIISTDQIDQIFSIIENALKRIA